MRVRGLSVRLDRGEEWKQEWNEEWKQEWKHGMEAESRGEDWKQG